MARLTSQCKRSHSLFQACKSPLPGDQVTVEIAQQMGSELSDLMEQHARAEAEENVNHDAHNAS
ncbi:hypothetical protein QJS10_CPA02g00403 [Acorus calamus]|uniref:Uncharacterized protein n=1 Tax=Acorus calamus TaxID=4465 RepID=A0AAV9FDT6_ACOCL|nr:hypothetical protein QJS10_CPA02g00403 [Acorus calamus]